MMLTQNFHENEFLRSETAESAGITQRWSSDEHKVNAKFLAHEVLQPLRNFLGQPITITSGYRMAEVNKLVGGSPTSQHLVGQAADFTIKGYVSQYLAQQALLTGIQRLKLTYDQLIFYPNFTHISYNKDIKKNRNQLIDKRK
jgi:uncharacterized protein YcbK (DUF882 family)